MFGSKHLSKFSKLTDEEIAIIKRVNNPAVIRTFSDKRLDAINPEKIDKYVDEIYKFWAVYNSTEDVPEFTESKNVMTKFIRTLDKKYRLPVKLSGATIIGKLRNMFKNNKISPYDLITLMDI